MYILIYIHIYICKYIQRKHISYSTGNLTILPLLTHPHRVCNRVILPQLLISIHSIFVHTTHTSKCWMEKSSLQKIISMKIIFKEPSCLYCVSLFNTNYCVSIWVTGIPAKRVCMYVLKQALIQFDLNQCTFTNFFITFRIFERMRF